MENLLFKIQATVKKEPLNYGAYDDLFSACREIEPKDFALAHETNKWLKQLIGWAIARTDNVSDFFYLYKRSLLFEAVYDFDSYLLYVEINRPPEQRFYQPRRKIMKVLVDAIQQLTDDELDELFLSMPPRVGKTTILMFLITWLIGRDSERSNLYAAYSDVITTAMYNGVLEILGDPVTYLWRDVFPDAKVIQTNAKDETINIDRKKRYPSLTCRSLYGTLNGACDCDGLLISDDLIGGIEEALNPERLRSAWSKVDNNLIPRAKESAKKLWCGTRWSLADPAGKRMELLRTDEKFRDHRWKIINLPALNEKDESNFDYAYGVGFSTKYYQMRRASFERNDDLASWDAQYMQEPIERAGTLFSPDDLRYYNGELPDVKPDRIFMAVDPAFGGGDYVAAPVCFMYGEDIYVHDVVYDNSDKKVTQPMLVSAIIKYDVAAMQIEANKSTEGYKEGVEELLKKKEKRINLTTKPAPTNVGKEQRIFDKAPDIRERMIFRESGKRSKPYEQFMQSVYAFKLTGRNKHDDAPDSLAMAIDMVLHPIGKAEVFKRPF
ncbi:MAG: phage terminase large subunit [Ruminococcus sp.]|nr:phage terminase large subunit [Ruminococcus sp.]